MISNFVILRIFVSHVFPVFFLSSYYVFAVVYLLSKERERESVELDEMRRIWKEVGGSEYTVQNPLYDQNTLYKFFNKKIKNNYSSQK